MYVKKTAVLRPLDNSGFYSSGARGIVKIEGDGKLILSVTAVGIDFKRDKYTAVYGVGDERESFAVPPSGVGSFPLISNSEKGAVGIFEEGKDRPVLYCALSSSAPLPFELVLPAYDDEKIAEENYYEYEKQVDNRLIGEDTDKNEQTYGNENAEGETPFFNEEKERAGEGETDENEAYGGEGNFYERIRKKLDDLFADHPSEENLNFVVANSKWVKVKRDENSHYAVGLIYKDRIGGDVKWICYGVPGRYGERPKEIQNYCSFIPSSIFSLKGKGYWVMFQSADSGICYNGR